jgi:hypothetical protein
VAVQPRIITVRRRERLFYVGMALAILVTVFAGFSRSYFLKGYFGSPQLSLLLHVHGLVFTSWILLFLAQTTLVAARRTDIHRRLGVLGGVLAALVIIVGTATAIIRVKQGATVPGVPPLSFLAVPLFDMVVFAILVAGAFYYRHRADVHKRLMTLAMIALLPAPIARLPLDIIRDGGLPAIFGLADLFLVVCLCYDLIAWRRIHPATAWGGLVILASQPLRLVISGTPAWLAVARWLTA